MSPANLPIVLGATLSVVCASACSDRFDPVADAGGGAEAGHLMADSGARDATLDATLPPEASIPVDSIPVDGSVDGGDAADAGIDAPSGPPPECPTILGVSVFPAELHPPEQASLSAGVFLAADASGTETVRWSAWCDGGVPIVMDPGSLNTAFGCGTAVPGCEEGGISCTVTLTVGLDGIGPDGGSIGQVCTGAPDTTVSETIVCEPGVWLGPPCDVGQTQCGSSCFYDCEDLKGGTGSSGFCGACGVTCPGQCFDGGCVLPGDASE
jgi:hypothetical protein